MQKASGAKQLLWAHKLYIYFVTQNDRLWNLMKDMCNYNIKNFEYILKKTWDINPNSKYQQLPS